MENFKKTALNIALAGAVFVGFSLPAHATGVLATATLELKNLLFLKGDGTHFSISDFSLANSTAKNEVNNVTAELNGTLLAAGPFSTNAFGPAPNIDLAPLCVGSGCAGVINNDFNTTVMSSALGDPTVNQAYTDSLIAGSVIDGPVPTTGANIGAEATVGLIGDGSAAAGVTNAITSSIRFTYAGPATTFNIKFDATAYMETFVSAFPKLPAVASAIANFSQIFTLKDLNTVSNVLNWTPGTAASVGTSIDAFNMTENVSSDQVTAQFSTTSLPTGQTYGVAQTGQFFATSSLALVTGHTYNLTASTNTSVSASLKVPEPASIALFGLGLLGLSQIRRKKQA
jgi:hypothetical protein